jgi:hypothetical protein
MRWTEENHEVPNVDRKRLTAVLEAAANDPVGLHILARSVIHGETYKQAASHFPSVTGSSQSKDAIKQRVSRLQRHIQGFLQT